HPSPVSESEDTARERGEATMGNERSATIVDGLGWGDEGKGSTVDYLCRTREITTVIRYNGGAQAGHNVVLADGRRHTFAQLGSATFVPGVRTYLSRYMMCNPHLL